MICSVVIIFGIALSVPVTCADDATSSAFNIDGPNATISTIFYEDSNVSSTTCSGLDGNCSLLNTTTTTAATTTQKMTTTSAPISKQREHRTSGVDELKYSKPETCSCDLKIDFCDVNCCCDEDCSFDNKRVFSFCKREPDLIRDNRLCKYTKHIYKNNTPYEWEVNQNGLFCIAKYNKPKMRVIQKEKKIKDSKEARIFKRNKYEWPEVQELVDESATEPETLLSNFNEYQHGDPVVSISNGTLLEHFHLPSQLTTLACTTIKHVTYLTDSKSRCHLSFIDEDNAALSASTFFANKTIISAPQYFNVTIFNRGRHSCPKNVCLPIQPQLCEDSFENCKNITASDRRSTALCQISIYNDEVSCENLVRNVKYEIYHNGSRGIKSVFVKFVLANVTHKLSDEEIDLRQEFAVIFKWIGQSLNYSSMRSGSPGYLPSKPVLVANLITNTTLVNKTGDQSNETEEVVQRNITRNPADFVDNFLTLPTTTSGEVCTLNNITHNVVEFGVNSIQKCNYHLSLNISSSRNASQICRELQLAIFDYWSVAYGNTTMKVFGNFGNADKEILDDWSPIAYYVLPNETLPFIAGNFTHKNESLLCYNISTTLKIDIFHSRVVYKNLDNQEKLIGILYDFLDSHSLRLNVVNDEVSQIIKLRYEVLFYDVTAQKIKRYAELPSLKIKLPSDFFYPFVKMNSGGVTLFAVSKVWVLLFVLILIV